MNRERRDFDLVHEFFETANAGELDGLQQGAIRSQSTFSHSDVEAVSHRAGATDTFRLQLRNETIFFAFQMQSFGRDLLEVNFHSRILSEFTF